MVDNYITDDGGFTITQPETKTDYSGVTTVIVILAVIAGVVAFDVWVIKKMGAKYFFMLLALEAVLSTAVVITKEVKKKDETI